MSRKESVKSFLTLMTNDLNDQLRTMTITMTAIRIEAINLHKNVVIWSLVILVIFVSGMCFQCHYINIIILYLYSESERECEILFDLNDT